MSFSREFLRGVIFPLKMTNPPLYRYPYRNSPEAFRSDWKHIGSDIDASFRMFEGAREGTSDE